VIGRRRIIISELSEIKIWNANKGAAGGGALS